MPNTLRRGTTSQEKEQPRKQSSGGKPHKPRRTTILVGVPWPEGIEVHVKQARCDIRDSVMAGLAILFGMLLTGTMAYAMFTSDAPLLKQGFNLVQYGLVAVAIWAVGRKAHRYFSRAENGAN
jgi:hypothetical protein